MNLQEIAADRVSNKVLQAKIRQQSRQIEQLQAENAWLREQLAKLTRQPDKNKRNIFTKRH